MHGFHDAHNHFVYFDAQRGKRLWSKSVNDNLLPFWHAWSKIGFGENLWFRSRLSTKLKMRTPKLIDGPTIHMNGWIP